MCIFICGLFNNVVSSFSYIVSSDRMINVRGIGKDDEESGHGLIESTILAFVWRD